MGCELMDGRRASMEPLPECEGARRSVVVWNLDMRSCRVDVDAPFSACWRELTATKPPGEDWLDGFEGGGFEPTCDAPFISATLEGLDGRMGGAGLAVALRSKIACFRPLSLWFSCRVRAATVSSQRSAKMSERITRHLCTALGMRALRFCCAETGGKLVWNRRRWNLP